MSKAFWYKINRPRYFMDWATSSYVENNILGNKDYISNYGPLEIYDVDKSYDNEEHYLSKSENLEDDIVVINLDAWFDGDKESSTWTLECTLKQFMEVKKTALSDGYNVKINCLYSKKDNIFGEENFLQ